MARWRSDVWRMRIRAHAAWVAAAILLGMSIWGLALEYPAEFPRHGTLNRSVYVIKQGLAAVLALGLALVMKRFLPSRLAARSRWVAVALLAVTAVVGLSVLLTGGFRWYRPLGLALALLAMVVGGSYALPRLDEGRRGGVLALAGLFLLPLLAAMGLLNGLALFFLMFAVLGLSLLAMVRGLRLWAALAASIAVAFGTLAVIFLVDSSRIGRLLQGDRYGMGFQRFQAMLAVHVGGVTGCRESPPFIPEWHTDFLYARVASATGLVGATVVMLAASVLLIEAWRVVAQRRDPFTRSLAAGCAAVLTAPVVLHLATNLGLFPPLAFHFPFLSYGPVLVLLSAMALGVLLALDRDPEPEAPVFPRWPTAAIPIGLGCLCLAFALRLHTLVFRSPDLSMTRTRQLERTAEQKRAQIGRFGRGRIVDVQGRVLAEKAVTPMVCAAPDVLPGSPDRHLLPELLRLLDLDARTFDERTSDPGRRYVRLGRVSPSTAEAVRRLSIQGIFIDDLPGRRYPRPTPLAHLVGFVNDEGVGGGGVEFSRNAQLAAGKDVRMTLDAELQDAVQAIAEEAAKRTGARQAQIIVMDPRRGGAILAAAQVPAVNGSDVRSAAGGSLSWRAVDVFEPGGLLQPLVVATALNEEGVITPDTRIDCENGVWVYQGIPLRDPEPCGELTPEQVLVKAGNIGMAKMGLMLGEERLYNGLLRWGLNERCTIGLGGSSGLLRPPSQWSKLEITRLPIGHGAAFSLLQILRAYTAFFNDGGMVEPCLTVEVRPASPRAAPRVPVSAQTARLVRAMLVRVVEEGTGRGARVKGLTVFGKTAVVQKPLEHASGYSDRVQAVFVGGFEGDDGEARLIAVWLDDLDRSPASNPAAAVFSAVADALGSNRKIKNKD